MSKKIKILFASVILTVAMVTIQNGCKAPESIANKTGDQLWGEVCNRCHNAPSPATYGDDQWNVLVDHMRVKAGLTDEEVNKILAFLKSAN